MNIKGDGFKWFIDGESRTYDEAISEINDNTLCTMYGLNVHYTSPKKVKNDLDEIEEHQAKIGGRVDGVEFPYDFSTNLEKEVLSEYDKRSVASTMMGTPLKERGVIKSCFLNPNEDVKEYTDRLKGQVNNARYLLNNSSKCSPNCLCSGRCKKITTPDNLKSRDIMPTPITPEEAFKNNYAVELAETKVGKKEIDGKLDYSEINFKLLDLMAKRFNDNKDKYPKGNTLKMINKEDIAWAAFRHIRKMLQPIDGDTETYEDHLAAVATNMSIILDQLDKK